MPRDAIKEAYSAETREQLALVVGYVTAGDELRAKHGDLENWPKSVRKFINRAEDVADDFLDGLKGVHR